MLNKLKILIISLLPLLVSGCSMFGSSNEAKKEAVTQSSSDDEEPASESALPPASQSNTVKFGSTLVKSVKNNSLTSRTVKSRAAADLARSLGTKNIKDLIDAVAAERIAGTGTGPVLARAKKLMDKLFTKGIEQDLPESVKLELGLAAVQVSNLALANVFLKPLLNSKNAKIKAGAHNAYGVLYLKMDETPDAILSFKKAISTSPGYPAALFNLGMLTLKYGDFALAKKYLATLQSDWYAKIGLAVAERQLMRNSQAESLCNSVLRTKGKHKMALYNCGLYFAENKGDAKKGRELITKATQIPGGERDWDEKAFKVLEKLK